MRNYSTKYIKTAWKDYPDTSTPINKNKLDKIEQGIFDLDQALNGGIPSEVKDLSDISIDTESLVNNSILKYDAEKKAWINVPPTETGGMTLENLEDLANVVIDKESLQNLSLLKYDAENDVWIGGEPAQQDRPTKVTVENTNPTTSQIKQYPTNLNKYDGDQFEIANIIIDEEDHKIYSPSIPIVTPVLKQGELIAYVKHGNEIYSLFAPESTPVTMTSQLINTSGFITEHQDISHKQDKLSVADPEVLSLGSDGKTLTLLKISTEADNISYDNTSSELTAKTAQSAIDEVNTNINTIQTQVNNVTVYDNKLSQLKATTIQGAIDEIVENMEELIGYILEGDS